jgi:hypothetical protein
MRLWLLLLGVLPLLAQRADAGSCDEGLLVKFDGLPDAPLSAVIPTLEQALLSCKALPPDLKRALESAVQVLRETGEPLPYDTALNAKLGQLHPEWWHQLCQPDEAHVLSKLMAYKERVGTPTEAGAQYVNVVCWRAYNC